MPFGAVMTPPAALVMPPAKLPAAMTQMPADPAMMVPLLVRPPANVTAGAITKLVVVGGWDGRTKPTPMPMLAEIVPLLRIPFENVSTAIATMPKPLAAIEHELVMPPAKVETVTQLWLQLNPSW